MTKTYADELSGKLWRGGICADSMHGGRSQHKRLTVFEQFKSGTIRVLVATDVLQRGVDIPNMTHVVIYEMNSIEDYVHRVGRTGRGKQGVGHALVFFEYYAKMPYLAQQLIDTLQRTQQRVPDELVKIADEVKQGLRQGSGGAARGGAARGGGSSGWTDEEWAQWRGEKEKKALPAEAARVAGPTRSGRNGVERRRRRRCPRRRLEWLDRRGVGAMAWRE